jgi:peptide/nickel transport system permease protein
MQRLNLTLGGGVVAVFVAAAVLSLAWTPYPVETLDISRRLQGPSAAHLFGTDQFGRDVLSMILAGARTSLAVALVAVVIGAGAGVPLGLLAAARGGLVDDLLMRGSDLVFAFPALVVAVMITAVFGASAVNAIIAIGIFNIPVFARLSRGSARALAAREFLLAARLSGKGDLRIAAEHVLPNIGGVLIIQATTQFALAILAEAGLSYVGLGAQPPAASWGRMLAEAQTMVALAPSLVLFPGLAIALSVLGFSLLGDGLRARLDPRLAAGR